MAKATSLTSSTRNIAGAVGVAALFSYLNQQTATHVQSATTTCGSHLQALALHACIAQQSVTMGMNDTFFLALIGCIVCAIATVFVGRDPALEAAKAAKKRGEAVEESASVPVTP